MQDFKTVFFRALFLIAVIGCIVLCSSHKKDSSASEDSACVSIISMEYRG